LDITRRNLLIGVGAVAIMAAGGLAYFTGVRDSAPVSGQGSPSSAELLRSSPLPEMALGSETAPVTIIEYASLTCSYCKNFDETTFPELKKRYIDTGKVRYIFREFVLNEVDLLGMALARCVSKDAYFPFVRTLFEKQQQWAVQNPVPPLLAISRQAGLTEEKFRECASNQQVIQAIQEQREQGSKLGVNSTPTFFINGEMRSGALTIEEMEKLIEPYLKG
jgi:protein-disulfide isomerase